MKKYFIIGAMLLSGMISAHTIEPKLEAYGNLVKATYYHENGRVQQTGFFKDGKLEGQWVSYDSNGAKTASGEYSAGEKTGTWVFFGPNTLAEVSYKNNKIESVKNWKQEAVVHRN